MFLVISRSLTIGWATGCLFCLYGTTALGADVRLSDPVGQMSVVIIGGTLSAPVTTSFSLMLSESPTVPAAQITSVATSTLGVGAVNWTTGAFAMPAYPYELKILTGAAAGVRLPVVGNTTDTVTVAGRDLTQLGIAAGTNGDRLQLIPVPTLDSIFGPDTFLGGSSPANSDIIILGNYAQFSYYFNTDLNRWLRTTGPTTDRGGTPIFSGSAISVTRKAETLVLRFFGTLGTTRWVHQVPNSGSTYTHTGFPTDVALGELSMQTRLPGWISASSADLADILGVSGGAGWLLYFHNGTHWQRTTGPATNRDSIVIPAGTPIQIYKRGIAGGVMDFTRELPFAL